MQINKVQTPEELDLIIPLINKLYENLSIRKHTSFSAYISWIIMNLPNQDFCMWYAHEKETGNIKGFVIIQKHLRLFRFECVIVDAYMDWNDTEFSDRIFEKIEHWAEDKQCQAVSCHTERPMAMCKRFGFEPMGTLLMKAV